MDAGLSAEEAMFHFDAIWRKLRRFRKAAALRLRAGLVQRAAMPLILPAAEAVPGARADLLARYVRRPNKFQPASSACLLVNGREAFPAMLSAIDRAIASVDLETYAIRADGVGMRFQSALLQAARRGIRVRLLYDYIGSRGLPAQFARDLMDAGVEVAVYHPLVFGRIFRTLNRRDHRKLLLVDQSVLFTGGLNLTSEYAAPEEHGSGWRDTHARFDGEYVAWAGERLFEDGWRHAIAYPDMATRTTRLKARVRRRLRRLIAVRDFWERISAAPPGVPGAGPVAVQVLGNQEFRHRWDIHRAYLQAIRHARRYILIENAYFLPDHAIRHALSRAVARGVLVAVAVPRNSDVPIVTYASRHLYAGLLTRGIRIFEWPHAMLHAKTAVIDDAWSVVGSYNLDRRSFFHQLEAVVLVVDPAFAGHLREQTLADLAQCREVSLVEHESRSHYRKLLESAAYLLRDWM